MFENPVAIVIVVAIVGGISAFALYFILRFLRGSIKLNLARTAFNPGENIEGSFTLITKKAIEGNCLNVSLIGVQETRTQRDGKTETKRHEIFRNTVTLEEAQSYRAGYEQDYNFEIPTPETESPEFLNSGIGQTLAGAVRLLSNRRTRIIWKVEARLDAKGIDLATSKKISLNIQNMI